MSRKGQNIVLIVASATIVFGIVATAIVLSKAKKERKKSEANGES